MTKFVYLSDSVRYKELRGDGVLLDLDSEQYFGLNEVANSFWHYCQGEPDLVKVLDQLENEYTIDRQTLEKDINVLLEHLQQAGLIRLEAG